MESRLYLFFPLLCVFGDQAPQENAGRLFVQGHCCSELPAWGEGERYLDRHMGSCGVVVPAVWPRCVIVACGVAAVCDRDGACGNACGVAVVCDHGGARGNAHGVARCAITACPLRAVSSEEQQGG